jgi:hypothetical protein
MGASTPSFLMTNADKMPTKQLAKMFSRRVRIEQCFQDNKSKRNGLTLPLTLVEYSDHLIQRACTKVRFFPTTMRSFGVALLIS